MNPQSKNRTNRLLRWMLRISILIAAVIIICLAMAPWLINQAAVKQRVMKEISQMAGVTLTYDAIDLSFIPRPHLTLTNGEVSIPGSFTASWRAMAAYPKLLPLLVRDVQISKVSIQQPEIDISLPQKTVDTDHRRPTHIAGIIRESIAPVVGSISAIGKDIHASIADGRATIRLQDHTDLRFTDIDARIDSSAAALDIDIQSKADFCETIAIRAGIDPKGITNRVQIDLVRLAPHRLPASWIPTENIQIGASPIDVGLTIHTDQLDGVRAEVQGTLPGLTVHRGQNQFTFQGQTFAGRFRQDDKGTTIVLSELKLDQPKATLGGRFFRGRDGGSMKVDINGKDVDIASVRQAASTLAGNIAEVKETLDIVKGGHIPSLSFTASGKSVSDLGTLENMTLTANLVQGEILVPGVQINATDVSAGVTLAQGVLDAGNLSARHGNTRVTDGTMGLGLSGNNPLFHLDIGITADLSHVPPILKQVVSSKLFLGEMDRFRDIKGQARGRLILGERLNTIDTTVRVANFVLSARAAEVPYLLELQGRDFSYSDASVAVTHLKGRIDASGSSQKGDAVNAKKGAQWLTETFHLPPMITLTPPLTLANGRFSRDQDGHSVLAGEMTIRDEMHVAADVALAPGRIDIKKLTLEDSVSQASTSLGYHENKKITFDFKGHLQDSTLNRLLTHDQSIPGWIKGDLHLEYVTDHPMQSTLAGNFKAQDLALSEHLNLPVRVKQLSVKGTTESLHLESDLIVEQDQQLSLKGNLNLSPDGILVDADLHSNGIKLDSLATALRSKEKIDDGAQKKAFWDLPLEGVVRLDSDSVSYGKYVWRPLHATATLHPEKITIVIDKANLCGVATPGTVTLTPDEANLIVTPTAHGQDLHTSETCLFDNTAKIEGSYDLSGEIKGRGPPRDLLGSLSGSIAFNADEGTINAGRVYRNITEILKLINITEIYRGRLPEMKQDGFAYHSVKATLGIQNDAIVLEEGIVEAHSLNAVGNGVYNLSDSTMDLTVLVAPLKTVDTLIKFSPILGHVAGGKLVSIPVSMKGNYNDPEINIVPPEAVSERLVGIMERSLNLPVHLFDSLGSQNK